MANESLLITCLPDGTYHVKETEAADGDGDQPIDQSVQSPDDVIQLVQQFLQEQDADDAQGGDAGSGGADAGGADGSGDPGDPQSAWDQEAATRDPQSGMRK